MDISIIIVSYNTCNLTIQCLESVFRETTGLDFEVIVVDNASNDGSASAITEHFPQVKLLACKENHGFALANNMAASHAIGEYLLLLNPDTVIVNHAVEKLLAFAKSNTEAGIYGGRTVFRDGSLNPTSCYGKTTLWSLVSRSLGLKWILKKIALFNPESYGSWKYDTVKQVDIITGCFLLIKIELWKKLGGFNKLFFMFGEEVDLCLRAEKIGVKPLFTPDAQIIHYGGKSEPIKANRHVKVLCAEITLIREHWPKFRACMGICIMVMRVIIKLMVFSLLAKAGINDFTPKAKVWEEVWQRRREWIKGWYPVS